jgi:hypothetical protein
MERSELGARTSRAGIRPVGLLVALSLLAGLLAVASPPVAIAATPGSITGKVTSAPSKAAVGGIQVCAFGTAFGGCATTNSSGEYTLSNVTAGTYTVEFSVPEEESGLNFLTQFYKGKTSFSEANPVSVTAGATTSGIDAALQPGGQISGKATDASTKAGVAGVEVCAYTEEFEFARCTTTNASGEYTLASLVTGQYTVEFYPLEGNYRPQYYNDKANFEEADLVSVTAGASKPNINAPLHGGGSISGKVTNASTKAVVEGIQVCAYGGESSGCATTNAAGEYTIGGLGTGEYKVWFASSTGAYITQYYKGKANYSEADLVPVTVEATTAGIDAALQPGGQITGKVTDATTKAAVEGIQVCASTSEFFFVRCGTTNAGGEYTITGLAGGEYKVSFVSSVTGAYITQYYKGKASFSEANPVSVAAASTTPGIDAALQPGGQITGKVTDASTKAGLAGITVCAYAGIGRCASTNAAGEYTVTGLPSGEYKVFFSSSSGNYIAQYYKGKSNFSEANPVPVTVASTTSGIDAALQLGGQITGKVTDAATKAAVSNVQVCASTSEFFFVRCASSNSGGEYTITGLGSGEYKVSFSPATSSYQTQYYKDKTNFSEANLVSVIAGAPTSGIDAALQPGGQITGKVTDAATKAAVSGVQVCASTSEFVFLHCASTNAGGEYTISGLAAGEYKVSFSSASNYITQYYKDKARFSEATAVTVTVAATTPGIDAALQSGGQLTGKVTDASTKAAVSGVQVCAYTSELIFVRCATTNAGGEYAVTGLGSGEYKVSFTTSAGAYQTQYYKGKSNFSEANLVSVTAGSTTPGIDAALQPSGQITGKVTDAVSKAAVAGIQVCATTSEFVFLRCGTTNSSGDYTISGLGSGEYKVQFSVPIEGGALNYQTQYYNGKASFAEANAVSVTTGATTSGINAALQPGGRIAGTVTDASTKGALASVTVCASGTSGRCAITNASGEYTIAGLAGGEYKVSFSSASNYITQYYNSKASFSEANPVSVAVNATTSGIDAALQGGGQITGKVTDAATKAALPAVEVCASTGEFVFLRCASTNASGEYTVSGLATGEYKVAFLSSGTYATQYYNNKTTFAEANAVAVTVGSTTPGVNAALQPAASSAPVNTGAPSISGSALVGGTLSCSTGSWTGSPAPTFGYRWLRDGGAITGATANSYVVQPADQGHSLVCEVTGTNSAGKASAPSAPRSVPAGETPPENTSAPVISGSAVVGGTLSCSTGSWTGSPAPTFGYRWLRDGGAITGATANSYVVQSGDQGHALVCEVTGTNSAGKASATSAPRSVPAEEAPPVKNEAPASSGGGGGGGGSTATTGVLGNRTAAPGLPAPTAGRTANLGAVSGSVLVRPAGSSKFVALSAAQQVPFETVIDATHGKVTITTAGPHGGTQTITLSQGAFKLSQGPGGLVIATLVGGDFSVCPTARQRNHSARKASKRASPKHVVRKLWAEGHGKFATKGNYAAGAVLGTRWLTEDLCEGTLIQVATDRVAVTDLVKNRHIKVKAGHSYLAKAP